MNTLSQLLTGKIPKYEITIPSSGKKTTFRPFLIKEEKILLIAQELQSKREILNAIVTIIEECVDNITNVSDLPIYDIEYLFIKLRAKSISETLDISVMCPETKEKVNLNINIDDLEIVKPKNHTNKIKIDDTTLVKMNHPSINILKKYGDKLDITDQTTFYDIIVDCIESIQTNNEIIDCKNIDRKELQDFIDNLNKKQFNKIVDFFLTSPRLEKRMIYKTSDGKEREVVLSGLGDFFG